LFAIAHGPVSGDGLALDRFPNDALARRTFTHLPHDIGSLRSAVTGLGQGDARERSYETSCK